MTCRCITYGPFPHVVNAMKKQRKTERNKRPETTWRERGGRWARLNISESEVTVIPSLEAVHGVGFDDLHV